MVRKAKPKSARPKVRVVPVAVPDAAERLSHAYRLVLRAAARAEIASNPEVKDMSTADKGETGGSHEER